MNQKKNDRFLDFLAIETFKMPDKNYEMNLIFSGDNVIRLVAEAIEVTLDDQGLPWAVSYTHLTLPTNREV